MFLINSCQFADLSEVCSYDCYTVPAAM